MHGRPRRFDAPLTDRQVEFVALMASGLELDAICDRFGITPHTARTHLQNIFLQLRMHSKTEVIVWWWAQASLRWHEALTEIEQGWNEGDMQADEMAEIAHTALHWEGGEE